MTSGPSDQDDEDDGGPPTTAHVSGGGGSIHGLDVVATNEQQDDEHDHRQDRHDDERVALAGNDAGGDEREVPQAVHEHRQPDPPGAPADDAFTDHVTSPIHDDAGDEFAPFGTDEGLAQTAVHVSVSRLGAKT